MTIDELINDLISFADTEKPVEVVADGKPVIGVNIVDGKICIYTLECGDSCGCKQ
jgi:hypothetical protein